MSLLQPEHAGVVFLSETTHNLAIGPNSEAAGAKFLNDL